MHTLGAALRVLSLALPVVLTAPFLDLYALSTSPRFPRPLAPLPEEAEGMV